IGTVKSEVAVGRLPLLFVSLTAFAVLLLAGAAAAQAAQEEEACLSCHAAEGLTLTLPGKESLPVTIDPKIFKQSVHGSVLTCATCHPNNTQYPHPKVAAKTLRDYKVARAEICRTCHSDVAKEFAGSIHGRALVMGFPDVPSCTSCHGDPRIMAKYGLRPVYEAYIREFHGVTTTLYKLTKPYSPTPAAICYDCHGVHNIKDTNDPAALVAAGNILTTCRKCHPTAGRLFASAWTEHATPGPQASPLVYYVQVFYRLLIPSVLGFLVMLSVLDLGRWAGDRLKGLRG